jgi:hypothetical protein
MAVWGGLSYFRYPEGGCCGGGADVVACVAEFIGAQGGHVCLDHRLAGGVLKLQVTRPTFLG